MPGSLTRITTVLVIPSPQISDLCGCKGVPPRIRALQVLLGLLNHTCKAVRAGHSFLPAQAPQNDATIQYPISHPCSGIQNVPVTLLWWTHQSETCNGVSMLHSLNSKSLPAVITSDVSRAWGCGAVLE